MPSEVQTVYSVGMLIQTVNSTNRHYDLSKILSAYEVAERAHEGQMRDSGEPYISHPLAVANILLQLGMDTDTVCAALLHDVVEDTDMTLAEIKKMFGQDVAMLVDGVTKLGKFKAYSKAQAQAENIRKILFAMADDVRVIIIKLCDRLHNMRTLYGRPDHKRRATSLETLSIYAPLANRLGMRIISDELEDIAFGFLDPFAYKEISELLKQKTGGSDEFISNIKINVQNKLTESGFFGNYYIEGRVKSVYAIYIKAYQQGKTLDEIYDKYAIRIIVDTIADCYTMLGLVHEMYTPLPNRFKDYIGTPKPNKYQSLHTTVLGSDGIVFEIQIRTWEMHHTAEEGIASHWKYKEGIHGKDSLDERTAWVRKILDDHGEAHDEQDILRAIKTDVAIEEIFAVTPKGTIISLPNGATVVDFAYQIHTEVGNRMKGAKVDGRIVPYNYQIQTGEVVEILTHKDPNHGPSRAWLEICKTNEAKSKIRVWFKKERREENIVRGKAETERELRRNGINIPDTEVINFLADDMKRHNCKTLDDFYAAVGFGGLILSKMMPRLKERFNKLYGEKHIEEKPIVLQTVKADASEIILDGEKGMLIKYSQCCNPLPGDEIIGFVTRGHGLSIHKKDCDNYKNAVLRNHEIERWVKVVWSETAVSDNKNFKATLDILANVTANLSGTLIADVATIIAEQKIPLTEIKSQTLKNGNIGVSVSINAAGVTQLSNLIIKLRKLPDVISVDRS